MFVLSFQPYKISFSDRLSFLCKETFSYSLHHVLHAFLAPDTSGRPLGGLSSHGCLSLGWVWVGAGLNYPRATGQSHLDPHCRGTLFLIEGIRTGQRARNWPGWRHPYSLTLYFSTFPPSPSITLSFRASGLFSSEPVWREDVTYHPYFTHMLLLLPPPNLTQTHTHTQALSPLCCDTKLMDYFSNWFQKCT